MRLARHKLPCLRGLQARRCASSLPLDLHVQSNPGVIFSGIQPTGIPHLGNYLGALREWVYIQNRAEAKTQLFFSLVDLHAITIRQDSVKLRRWKKESLAILLAIGLDPSRSTLFYQSHVSGHSELMWILACLASTGKLDRMTQWKDKTRNERVNGERFKLGLYAYPVLQAADILLYRATHVPVGEDQAQHLELSRELASTFNHLAEATVLIPPQTLISPASRVMSLTSPNNKMSKSDPDEASRILLTDTETDIRSKIKKAKTDSLGPVTADLTDRPGVMNLLEILHHVTRDESNIGTGAAPLAKDRAGMSLRDLKEEVADAVAAMINPIRDRFVEIMEDEALLNEVSTAGAELARTRAAATLKDVKAFVGLA